MMEMSRRKARELALQVLYQVDIGQAEADRALERTIEILGLEGHGDPSFARDLVHGVRAHGAHLDAVIARLSKDWRLERITYVDRNILRMGLYEILYRAAEVPRNVAVNEAVELAKKYGTEESGRFVNGILGRVVENPGPFMSLKDELPAGEGR